MSTTLLSAGSALAQDTLGASDFSANITPQNGALMALGVDNCSDFFAAEAADRITVGAGLTESGLIDTTLTAPFYVFEGEVEPEPLGIGVDDADADAGVDEGDDVDSDIDYTFHAMLWRSTRFTTNPGSQCAENLQTGGCSFGPLAQESCRCLSTVTPNENTVSFRESFQINDLVSNPCSPGNREVLHMFFRYYQVDPDQDPPETTVFDSTPASIIIDLERPPAPTRSPLGLVPGDGQFVVSLPNPRTIYQGLANEEDALNDLNDYEICYRVRLPDESTPIPRTVTNDSTNDGLRDGFRCVGPIPLTTSYTLTGLTNNTEYWITYAPRDQAGNRGPNAAAISGTPVGGAAFSDIYQFQGGGETGGCQAAWGRTPWTSLVVLLSGLLVGLGAFWRRRA
ncbi:MAG: hypothetical protein ACE366_29250 [Bradymonadia bacterium]